MDVKDQVCRKSWYREQRIEKGSGTLLKFYFNTHFRGDKSKFLV